MIRSLYLGPEYDLSEVEGDTVNTMQVAKLLEERKVVAVFQGRSEAGPRALGNRSILYDPTDPEGKDKIDVTGESNSSIDLLRLVFTNTLPSNVQKFTPLEPIGLQVISKGEANLEASPPKNAILVTLFDETIAEEIVEASVH